MWVHCMIRACLMFVERGMCLCMSAGRARSPKQAQQHCAHLGVQPAQYAGWGADALAVLTDLDYTSTGYADMVAACRATKVPVLQRDWFLHPLQAGPPLQMRCASLECPSLL